ncbi:glycosyl hydrolase family 18 protein [Flammeovirga sp. EKP202]|uniref:glycosyl hydrolase family 18 protein n=1 Tax=Flammeovirga sp. EKP202 TaxID=2770592 RepID=UPI00165FEBF4|nr:glycosyl hydrolase family 18 protein [Flammeovirga sp. EKP202]MBD0405395.1 T9SS type A sorting domain-containing protein [Flammeovirga sp. EKP202]
MRIFKLLLLVSIMAMYNATQATTLLTAMNASPCDGVAEWNSSTTYAQSGTKVVHNGKLYSSKWWTKGDTPGEAQWGPWEEIGICDDNLPPTVTFASPANNSSFVLEETTAINFIISATDDDGTIESTSITVDGITFSGNNIQWTPTQIGSFTAVGIAIDNQGSESQTTLEFTITSNEPTPPSVSFTTPSDGDIIKTSSLAPISIQINTSDEDGTIVASNITVEGQTFNSSSALWTPSDYGTFTITGSATDNDNLTSNNSITVTIEEVIQGNCSYPEYAPYPSTYNTNDIVVYQGDLFEAQVDNLYNITPGEADHWWKPLGPCVDTNTAPSITTTHQTSVGLIATTLNAGVVDAEGDPITVSFTVDGTVLEATQTNTTFSTQWTPTTYGSYNVTVNASDDKGKSSSASYTLTVNEPQGPQYPVITSFSPADNKVIKQTSLSSINLSFEASDIDGSIVSSNITVEGTTYNGSSATWTPSTFGSYTILFSATDDEGLTTEQSISITIEENLAFTDKVLVGYWHNWNLSSVPYIRLKDVDDRYNVICIAFAEPKIRDIDNTMVFDPIDINNFQNEPSDASRAEFKADVAYLQSKGKKVILSLGGANGVVHLDNEEEQQKFVTSMINLCETYGFDGVDIDLEGSSLTLNAGDNDFTNPTTPRVLNFIEGMQAIKTHFGPSFLLTSAPETAYVQGGQTAYGGSWGGYLPILHTLRDQLDYVHVQLYNTGSLGALDGKAYTQGSADFIVAMTEMLLQGFETKSVAGFFPPFREDQVALGLPANKPAAPAGGYTPPAEVQKALNYLVNGISFGGAYKLVKSEGYPDLRGMMTWSINWDKTTNYEYAQSYDTFFNGSNARTRNDLEVELENQWGNAYPNPFESKLTIDIELKDKETVMIQVLNANGQLVYSQKYNELNSGIHHLNIPTHTLSEGIHFIKLTTLDQTKVYKVLKNK